jgi:uncharacterized protein DUF6912
VSGTRVFVATSWSGLRGIVVSDGIGPAPFFAHAVTDELRAAYPEGGEEEWEYAALTAAARTSLGLIGEDDATRRVVVAVDAETVLPAADEDPTVVEVGEVVPYRKIAAVLVDPVDAQDLVAEAAACWADAEAGDEEAERVVDRCLDLDLAWYATQEIGDLLEQ